MASARRPRTRSIASRYSGPARIERTDGLAESVRDDMVLILKENFYSLFAKKRVEPWLDVLPDALARAGPLR